MRDSQVTQRFRSAQVVLGRFRLWTLPLAIAFLAFTATPALAGVTHPLKARFGSFSSPSGIAIDEANGNVFVAGTNDSVEIFGPEGGAPSGVGVTKIEGFDFGYFNGNPSALAIDNSSTSPSKGALYVTDVKHDSVKKFTIESGQYKLAGELNATPALQQPIGVAVNNKGDVFVTDTTFGATSIVEFSPTGTETARFAISNTVGVPSSLAIDSAGDLFVQSFGGKGVWKLAANGAGKIEPDTTPVQITVGPPNGVAIDQSTDTLYVLEKKDIDQYSASCLPQKGQCPVELEFGQGKFGIDNKNRIAVNPVSGDIYLTDTEHGDVAIFARALAIVPDVPLSPATLVTQSSATLNGTLSAAAGPPAGCQFEYTTAKDFESKGFDGAASAPCVPGGPFTGTAKEAVKADLSGLGAETTYFFRLLGENENGSNPSEPLSFTTVGKPKIDASFVSAVTFTSVTLEGLINPNGGPNAAVPTTYAFEYVSQADFEASDYASAIKVPAAGEGIGSGAKDVKVSQQLSGLDVAATYHFRLVAENEAGEEQGPDKTFTTYAEAPAGLPDGRVYEQVTPVDKNGAAPRGRNSRIQAAPDGSGIIYFSHGGIPGSEGAQTDPRYLASRASDWSSRGLLPPASSGSLAAVLGWSEDLSHAYLALQVLAGQDYPVSMLERDSASGALQPIAAEGSSDLANAFNYVDASADGSVVALEANSSLSLGGTADRPNVYIWDQASGLSLAGVFNNGQAPEKGSLAGSNELNFDHHYTQAQHTLASDGSRVFFKDAGTGQLYMRQNPSQPQSPMAGKVCVDPELACTVQLSVKGKSPATFWTATPDGAFAFFTSSDKLTANANTGPKSEGNDLYRYDAGSGVLTDLTPDPSDANGAEVRGVLGASDDGSYVYFAANGVLAPGATPGDCTLSGPLQAGKGKCNLYLSHEGATTFVAPLLVDALGYEQADSANWLSAAEEALPENTARVSSDGQTLLFRSQERLDDYDNEGVPELYLYRASSGELRCVSCNPTGAAPLGPAMLRSANTFREDHPPAASLLTRNLSAGGGRVFFETLDKLVAADTDGDQGCPSLSKGGQRSCLDVYEWEANGTGSCHSEAQNGGCIYLISTGTSTAPSYFADASASGDDAFFFTEQSLVGQDTDQIVDIYDARVGGGIASQNPPPPPPVCEGEACKGAVPPAPATASPGSSSFSGPANKKPSRQSKKRHHKHKKHKKSHAAKRHG